MSTYFTKRVSPGHVAILLSHWEALVKVDHRYHGSLELQNAKPLTWTYEPDQLLEIQRNEIQLDPVILNGQPTLFAKDQVQSNCASNLTPPARMHLPNQYHRPYHHRFLPLPHRHSCLATPAYPSSFAVVQLQRQVSTTPNLSPPQ